MKYVVCAAAALMLVACRGGERRAGNAVPAAKAPASHKTSAVESVDVVLWHAYRDREKQALEQVAEAFNKSHESIHLKLMNIPYDAFVDKVTIATPRGQGPDLFIFAHNLIGDWVDHYHILEPISRRVSNAVLDRFIPQTVKALVYKRSLYGLPLAFKSLVLFYDPLLVPKPPDTAEELAREAEAATDKSAGRFGLVFEAGLLYFDAPFIHGFGGEILDAAGRPAVDGPGVVRALEWLRGLVRSGVIPKGVNSAMVTSLFNDGKAAMVVNGPWFLGEIAKDKKFDVTLLPKMGDDKRASPYLGSEAVFLSAFSNHKDAALKVMDFLTTDESALTRMKVGRQTVANKSIYRRTDVAKDRVVSVFRAQAENSVLMPSVPQMQVVWSTMDTAINKAVFGKTEPNEALKEAQARILSDISKMKK